MGSYALLVIKRGCSRRCNQSQDPSRPEDQRLSPKLRMSLVDAPKRDARRERIRPGAILEVRGARPSEYLQAALTQS